MKGIGVDIKEYNQILHELFECGFNSAIKCEMCEQDDESEAQGVSLCVYGKLDKHSVACIKSITEKHNIKYMQIKGEKQKALKIYTPK